MAPPRLTVRYGPARVSIIRRNSITREPGISRARNVNSPFPFASRIVPSFVEGKSLTYDSIETAVAVELATRQVIHAAGGMTRTRRTCP